MATISEDYKKTHGLTPETIADTMLNFYTKVDEACQKLLDKLERNNIRLNCKKGCCHCCQDNLTMTQAEAAVIRKLFPNIGNEKPHDPGACPFLDENGLCRIYIARPYICRTHGLPMRWIEGTDNSDDTSEEDDPIEQRDICELNDDCIDLIAISPDLCWNSEVAEMQLAIMNIYTYSAQVRIPMRSFFDHKSRS